MEWEIQRVYHPFIHRVFEIDQKAGASLPIYFNKRRSDLSELCGAAPQQLRDAIAAFEHLSFCQVVWKDGSVDVNTRAYFVYQIQRLFN